MNSLVRGWIGFAVTLCVASAASALNITPVTPALVGGTNSADTVPNNSSTNRSQNTSSVSTTQTPLAAPDTVNSFSEFTTRYAAIVAADRTNTSANTAAALTSAYTITFTVDNPTGANLKIDINTLLVGSLTSVSDTTGTSTVTLNPITGQLNSVNQAELGLAGASQSSAASFDVPFSQAGSTLTILTSALTSNYVLRFDWTSSVLSAQDGAALRMGLPGAITSTTADDYPGVGTRTQADDGHFVTVRATVISTPEPGPGALMAFGLLGLVIRARRARH